jgi:hypothetical protein
MDAIRMPLQASIARFFENYQVAKVASNYQSGLVDFGSLT